MKPLTFTLITMGIIVVVFYPLFLKTEVWVKKLSMKVIKSGKSVAGKFMGLTLVFVFSIAVLGYFYAKAWYHIDLWKALVNGTIGRYL